MRARKTTSYLFTSSAMVKLSSKMYILSLYFLLWNNRTLISNKNSKYTIIRDTDVWLQYFSACFCGIFVREIELKVKVKEDNTLDELLGFNDSISIQWFEINLKKKMDLLLNFYFIHFFPFSSFSIVYLCFFIFLFHKWISDAYSVHCKVLAAKKKWN